MLRESFSSVFNTVMADNGFSDFVSESVSRKFQNLSDYMLETNKSMNLTAIKEENAVILRHFADSLTVARFLPENAKILDVGCGAGFPCLPLGICRPDLEIVALDSTEKRIRYVESAAKLLELCKFSALAARAEDAAHTAMRESFDICTARAVAALPVLAELCLPFVRVGGRFIAMKAKRGEEELAAAKSAITRLGGKVARVHEVTLRGNGEEDARLLIEVEKISPTPKEFPRAYAKILKRPL